MLLIRTIILLIFVSFLAFAETFSLQSYMGKWHEIYSIPNHFQKDCFNVTADYSIKENKKVKVVNVCRDERGNFKKSIEGEATVKDLSKRWLKVYFYRPLGINMFGGDYQILGLGEEYQWAVVGEPKKKYGWILSRKTTLTDDELKEIKSILKENNYRFEDFKKTQTNL